MYWRSGFLRLHVCPHPWWGWYSVLRTGSPTTYSPHQAAHESAARITHSITLGLFTSIKSDPGMISMFRDARVLRRTNLCSRQSLMADTTGSAMRRGF